MKGIVFNLVEEAVRARHGDAAWDDLLDQAGVSGAYTSLGQYPDDELLRLVAAAADRLHQPPEAILRWIGHAAMPVLAAKCPQFFKPHTTTRSLMLALNSIIHPEVRKLYPGAEVPQFDVDSSAPDRLVIGYRSGRRLCALAEGFIEGAARQFGEHASIEHPECMHRGAASCRLVVAFHKRN